MNSFRGKLTLLLDFVINYALWHLPQNHNLPHVKIPASVLITHDKNFGYFDSFWAVKLKKVNSNTGGIILGYFHPSLSNCKIYCED